ncbi:MAG: response regulator [Sphingobium sp.]|nr:response regulator [Sphingobium sp.]
MKLIDPASRPANAFGRKEADLNGKNEAMETHSEAEAELRRARDVAEAANAAKTRYLAAVSHEIRAPLNAIFGYAQLLERDGAIPPVEAGQVIRRSAEHLTDLVEGLLEISHIESGVLKLRSDVVPLPLFLDHVVDMFRMQAEAKGLAFDYVVKGRLPRLVRTDQKRLRQILINLLSNAIKYTQAGSVALSVSYRNQVADFDVTDTGIGIAPDDIERIFEPFERGSSPGANAQPGIGLGLAITRLLARVLGGEIFVRSAPGEGSSFKLRLFLPEPNSARTSDPDVSWVTGYAGPRKTVLVIDDDLSQASVMTGLLRPLGFQVFTASQATEGLALAGLCSPDIVLLDVQMPGLSGWQVADRLRAKHGDAFPIVMVSASVQEYRAGGDGTASHDVFVTKPVNLEALLDVIGRLLGLEWQSGRAAQAPEDAELLPPVNAGRYFDKLRLLAKTGHVREIEKTLAELAADVPESAPVVAALRGHLGNFDLRSLVKMLDDVDPR